MEKNFGEYVYFCYVGNNAGYSFRNYVDPNTGLERGYIMGYDKNRNPVLKNWEFDNGPKRQIRVHINEKDREGQKAVDFLRDSPECYQSKNGKYVEGDKQVAFLFREINTNKDAEDAISTRAKVINAQKKALDLKGQELVEVANIIGVFSDQEAVLSHKVLDFSSNFPDRFVALLEDPSRKVKALIKKALNDKVLTLNGKMVMWESKNIGADEDDAVSNLMKDDKLMAAIKLHIQKFGGK